MLTLPKYTMKLLHKLLPTVLAMQLIIYLAYADTPLDQSKIKALPWEAHSGIVDFAITLNSNPEKKPPVTSITIYLKNISDSPQSLVVYSKSDEGFTISYVDIKGVKHMLHDRTFARRSTSSAQERAQEALREMRANSGSSQLVGIAPGETKSWTINVSLDDLAVIKKYPVQCGFSIINSNTSQVYQIESSSKSLEK